MRTLSILFFLTLISACNSQVVVNQIPEDVFPENEVEYVDPSVIDTLELGLLFDGLGNYNSIKAKSSKVKAMDTDGKAFEAYLLNEIVPFWYGTEWDFNGYTDIPRQGVIACGYFVSTTLKHAGLKINRYKMAQQAGLHEAQTLALVDDNYITVYGIDNLMERLRMEYSDGLYFVGLDNHVGYLYIKNGTPYFLHSNYIEDRVQIQKAYYADAFQSDVYVLAEISTNKELMAKWRKGEVVNVVLP
ncbi:MAG: hypothetical protein ACI865_002576 [Flavobacteriaceae bacterium]|jgi:hypothetical protein